MSDLEGIIKPIEIDIIILNHTKNYNLWYKKKIANTLFLGLSIHVCLVSRSEERRVGKECRL